jgi:hypothetical protein
MEHSFLRGLPLRNQPAIPVDPEFLFPVTHVDSIAIVGIVKNDSHPVRREKDLRKSRG